MSTPWRAAAAGLDLTTAVCAALNLTYFFHRFTSRWDEAPSRPDGRPSGRRVAAVALALVSLGAMVESLFLLASLMTAPVGSPLASLPWTLARALPFAGTAFISILILRRIASG